MTSSLMSTVEISNNGAKRRRIAVQNDDYKRSLKKVWLPNETWTHTFRWLSRRDLLRSVQPSCRRFHAICEWNVPNVHVIRRFDSFLALLAQNSQIAKTHMAHLTGSKVSLAKHFQLTGTMVIHANIQNEMRVLRHSAELFQGCQIQMRLLSKFYRKDPAFLARRLAVIKSIRPCSIEILTNFLESDQLLRNPLVLACPRISLHEELCLLPRVATICRWLHHLPKGQKSRNTPRLLNLNWRKMMMRHKLYALIDRCKEMLLQAKSATHRRSYMLIFRWWEEVSRPGQRLALCQLKNELTGEVLRLEGKWIKIGGCYHFHYLLRRCLQQTELSTIGRHFLRDLLQDTFGMPQKSPHETDGAHFVHFRAQTKEEKCQMTVPRLKMMNLHGEETQGQKGGGPNCRGIIG